MLDPASVTTIIPDPPRAGISEHGARSAAGRLGITVAEYREHEARDEHYCPRCGYWLPRRAFPTNQHAPRGVSALCKWHRREEVAQRPSSRARGITYAGPAYATPTVAPVEAGHALCPAVLGCRSGRLPEGWVREGAHAS